MVPATERRRYHPGSENVPLSVAVREAVEAHSRTSLSPDEFELYEHIDPEALDDLFQDIDETGVIVQFHLTNVIVSVWSDGAIDIRVTEETENRLAQ